MRARRVFEERLSFSPRRADARALLEQVLNAERAGRIDEASRWPTGWARCRR